MAEVQTTEFPKVWGRGQGPRSGLAQVVLGQVEQFQIPQNRGAGQIFGGLIPQSVPAEVQFLEPRQVRGPRHRTGEALARVEGEEAEGREAAQVGRLHDRLEVPTDLDQVQVTNRTGCEQFVGVLEELARGDIHLVHETSSKHRTRGESAEWSFPLLPVSFEQFLLSKDQFWTARIFLGEPGERNLDPDEGCPSNIGSALLFQPVGEDEPGDIVVGKRPNALEEGLSVGQHRPPATVCLSKPSTGS